MMTPLRRHLGTTSLMVWALVMAGTNTYSGPSPTPNASFGITRVDIVANTQLVAPVGLWFKPTSITGFVGFDGNSISEPAGTDNVYDPTANEIFWSWDFGEPGYVPFITPNVPLTHRDTNRAFVKQPCHVFWKPQASTTVTLYGYDTAGNWGTATYVFGPDGDSPAIQDPDDYFDGADTIFFSKAGIYPDAGEIPSGALTTTSESSVNSRITSRVAADGAKLVRLRLRRGETYTDIAKIGQDRPCYVDSYGDPLAAPPKQVRTKDNPEGHNGGPFAFGATEALPEIQMRFIDQDWQGPYDASTETGFKVKGPWSVGGGRSANVLCHRVRISGGERFSLVGPNNTYEQERVVSDFEITNFKDYGVLTVDGTLRRFAILGSDLHQASDALNGIMHGGSSQNPQSMGNTHGPIRTSGVEDLYLACSSFFSRSGWSTGPNTAWSSVPPSTAQLAFRFGAGSSSNRNVTQADRCSFEGGNSSFAQAATATPDTTQASANVLFESCLFVASAQAWGSERGMLDDFVFMGQSVRNSYFYVPAVSYASSMEFRHLIKSSFNGDVDPAKPITIAHFNNTAIIEASSLPGGDITRVLAFVDSKYDEIYLDNNVYYAPNLPTPSGVAFAPLGTSALAGFTPRFLGTKWNFKPVGWQSSGSSITCQAGREIDDGIGKVTGVANNEWMAFDYPDFSGQCDGAGDALMAQVALDGWAAVMAARTGSYDQVSIFNYGDINFGKCMAPSAAGGDGRVLFDFTDTKIRVQNLTGGTRTGDLWILLDLRDWLMDFKAGTASPSTIPAPVPGTGSAAILETEANLFAQRDFFGNIRQGKKAGGQTAITGKPIMQGAFVEVPA